jgi:hypothetical protein
MSQASAVTTRAQAAPPLFAFAIFTSAALVFMVEPMIAKLILPKLGGSPAVWNTSMVFFQAALLGGYAYAHVLQRIKSLHVQVGVHLALLVVAALTLPLKVTTLLGDPVSGFPIPWLLGVLAVSIGAPFAVLSATAPLLQAWYARVRAGQPDAANPYVLYAASNLGSFVALLAYPALVEPLLHLSTQTVMWTAGYGMFVVLVGVLGWISWNARDDGQTAPLASTAPIPWREKLIWVLLAAGPSSLMLGVTLHLTMDIASAPFLWVIPLAIYLLTFVLAFSSKPLIPLKYTLLIQGIVVAGCISLLPFGAGSWALQFGLNVVTFFLTALTCHQILAARRPPPDRLTEFYLLLSLGGVIGGIFNALIAPLIFHAIYEYPIVLVLVGLARPWGKGWPNVGERVWLGLAVLMTALTYGLYSALKASGDFRVFVADLPLKHNAWDNAELIAHALLGVAAIAAFMIRDRALIFTFALACIAISAEDAAGRSDWIHSERSFFGVLRVAQADNATYEGKLNSMLNGTTLHGAQTTNPKYRCHPMTYYAPATPIGQSAILVQARPAGRADIGVVGLGSGAMAAYKRAQDSLTYYEIDPKVLHFAENPKYFSYITNCAQGPVNVVMGDARLSLFKEPDGKYDLLIVDAFSSDSVPTHLLTVEALRLYLRKVKPDGVVLLHLSNRNLEITSSSIATARAIGAPVLAQLYAEPEGSLYLWATSTEAIVLAKSDKGLADFRADPRWRLPPPVKTAPWTDDYTNLIGALWRHMWIDGSVVPASPPLAKDVTGTQAVRVAAPAPAKVATKAAKTAARP